MKILILLFSLITISCSGDKHYSVVGVITKIHSSRHELSIHHDEIENDPYYIWSGMCEMPWALSLRKTGKRVDLSSSDASVRWRSRQSGNHGLHLLIKLPGEHWFISEQSDAGQEWHDFEFRIQDLTWRHYSIIKAVAEERVSTPSLAKVEQIGFTDQKAGKSSKFSSRLDWIEVRGTERTAPPRWAPWPDWTWGCPSNQS